jgi:ATP-dependent RNA helicase RhlE
MAYNQRSNYRSGSSQRGGYNQRTSYRSRGGGGQKRRGQYIDPAKFVKKAKPVTQDVYEPKNTFSDFNLHPVLHANLEQKGYKIPSAIQDQTIPHGIEGRDIIGIANTGTGKTAAFALPLLHKMMEDKGIRALIVAPTRELAEQILEECKSIAKGSGLSGALLIGGSSMVKQLRDLKFNPRIVIGTPGRIKDHLERGSLNLNAFNSVVLDEVDRMLDMGFLPDMQVILGQLAKDRQSLFFSATMDPRVRTLIETFSNEPITVSVKTGDTSENVNQDVVRYSGAEDKLKKLHELLNSEELDKVIIFDETQRSVEKLWQEINRQGIMAEAMHGGKSQGQRQQALRRFKEGKSKVMVATDVAARGIDVSDITHVINFGMPQTYEDYTHRIGRAGRAGRVGYALTFVQH